MTEKTHGPKCECCGSTNLEYITRVTGFYSKVTSWNLGKRGERRLRKKAKLENKKYLAK
jgi:ribonucleoside-triphosphate reductase